MPKWVLFLAGACVVAGLAMGLLAPVHAGAGEDRSVAVQPVDEAWRAALPADPDGATAAYLARLAPDRRARSDAYYTGGYWLQGWDLLLTLATMGVLLLTGASAAMRNLAERVTRRRPLQTMIYVVQFLGAGWVLNLPMTVYAGFLREHQYGFATQAFGPWLGEEVLSLTVSLVFGAILGALIYGVFRRFRESWVMLATGVATLFAVVGIVIAPVFVDPLFNTYTPMAEGPVKHAILQIARANGVPVSNVYQFDASRQTTRVSANVSGLLGTAAVRLNDNLLTRCSLPEIEAVMAHEVGHYVLNHVPKMLVGIFLVLAAGFWFLEAGFPRVAARWGRGVTGIADLAGMPIVVALLSLFMFAASPVLVGMIRLQEVEADYFALNASMEPDGFAEAQLKLIEYRKADPGALEEVLFYDHPSPRLRIRAAMQWKAERQK